MSLWASTTAPKVPLDAADGDEAEPVRARFRERVSSPCGEDGEVEPAGHPPGGGGCAALFPSSRCMEEKLFFLAPMLLFITAAWGEEDNNESLRKHIFPKRFEEVRKCEANCDPLNHLYFSKRTATSLHLLHQLFGGSRREKR